MIALDIYSNGKRVCTTSPEGLQILTAAATWHESGNAWDFHVRGITHEQGYEEHLSWIDQKLNVGDRVTIKVVETKEPDEPKRRYRIP